MKNVRQLFVRFTLLLFLSLSQETLASHGMGWDITYTHLGGNQYRVRLSFYRDCNGITEGSSQSITITNGCGFTNPSLTVNLLAGYPQDVSPLCGTAVSVCAGGTANPAVQLYLYEGVVTLPGTCADWRFSFTSCCRNASITTITTPDSQSYYVEALLNNTIAPGNTSPYFTNQPVGAICVNQIWNFNNGAVEPDGDILVYSLIPAKTTAFTADVPYLTGFSGPQPFTTIPANNTSINTTTGQITVNVPSVIGQVTVFGVLVEEYRGSVTPANKVGHVMRDLQISVQNCTNTIPTVPTGFGSVSGGNVSGPLTVQTCPGANLTLTFNITDPNTGQILTVTWNNGIPGGTFSSTGTNPVTSTFTWTPGAGDVGTHTFTVTAEDNNCPVVGQSTFTVTVQVLQGTDAGPNQVTYCGVPVQLNATGGTTFTWTVLGGGPPVGLSCATCPNPVASPTVTTTYVVQSNVPPPCPDRDTITVIVAPGFNLTMSPDTTICRTSSTVITATPDVPSTYTYSWNPITGLSSATVANPTASPTVTTTYTCTVTDLITGCQRTGTVTVTVVASDINVTSVTSTPPSFPCVGGANTLTANIVAGDCNVYQRTAVTYAAPPAGGYTTDATTDGCDDCVSGAIPIGFTFTYYCTNYTNVYISSNGFISFDAAPGSGCCSGQNIPNTATPNNLIALCWTDLNPGSGGSIRYKTIGTAPNRQFIVFYDNVRHFGSTSQKVTGYIILHETTNYIDIMSTQIDNDGGVMTQGVERAGGTAAVPSPGRNATSWGATNDGNRFQPTLTPYTVTWYIGATPIGTGNPLSTTTMATTTYTAVVQPTSGPPCTATGSVTVTVGCPLPIELTDFRGHLAGRDGVLNWFTQTEANAKGFDVERSLDGVNFSKIGFVNAKGNSAKPQTYSFTDKNLSNGKYFYRLRIVSMDGQATYSNIVELKLSDMYSSFELLGLYPNPADDNVTISYAIHKAGDLKISVIDLLGRQVLSVEDVMKPSGNHQSVFSVKNLPSGQYIIKCQHGSKNEFYKLAVTH